jgi:competence protein ComEC
MKIPVVWCVAAFASGILLASRWREGMPLWVAAAVAAMLIGAGLAWRKLDVAAFAFALAAWIAVGACATEIERADLPSNHVARLIASNQIATDEPLRWQGRLREDPIELPWGVRYEIDLERVEIANEYRPVRGGLRVNWYGNARMTGTPANLRAGDRVEALVKARPPRNFLDPGAYDLHGALAREKIDLIGSLRSGELLQLIDHPRPTFQQRLSRARGSLLKRLDGIFPGEPARAALLRAMLLGDRSFVDSEVVTAFQKTAAYHVLVVAGLHVGALAVFLLWVCRRLRLPITVSSLVTLLVLAAYAGIVQDRPPILRAALVAAFYLCARPLFRRIDLLNTVALAALVILAWKPSSIGDPSFELSFLAAGAIAGVALPWMDRTSAPYRAGLRNVGDVTRDGAYAPKIAQFRIEMRMAAERLASKSPQWLAHSPIRVLVVVVRAGLRLWEIVLLSVVIQWGMSPLLAQDFHRFSLTGPISNIAAVLLTGLIVPLGFLALAATFLWNGLALTIGKVLGALTGLLLASVQWFAALPRVSYRIPGSPLWLDVSFFAVLMLLAAAARVAAARRKRREERRSSAARVALGEWVSAVLLAALTVLVAWHPFAPSLKRGKLEVSILDVGQGDSIFAALPDGRTMLVDGGGLAGSEWIKGYRSGGDIGEEVVSPYLWSRGLKRLDVVALTHADHDHIDGLLTVLENFRVGQLWIGRDDQRPEFKRLLSEAHAHGVRVVRVAQGSEFGRADSLTQVLWPPQAGAGKSSNDNSIVLRLTDGRVHFLLTGDIERAAEKALVEENAPLAADLLKVPHHGSKTSSTEDFLAAVAPREAVASVGAANPFGHPAASVVERYEQAGVPLLRTDRDGAITAVTDGTNLSIHRYAEQQF